MTSPILQAEGAVAAVTTGNLSITLPSYQANDIVVINSVAWIPNSVGAGTVATMSSPWDLAAEDAQQDFLNGTIFWHVAAWWARATSNSSLGTSVTVTRGTGWDTGTDTCFAGRAYVIRGCITTGLPFDDSTSPVGIYFGYDSTYTSNGNWPTADVYGGDRLLIYFVLSADNQAIGSPGFGSYTAGTADTTNTGTDAGFQTFRLSSVKETVSGQTYTGNLPAQGYMAFMAGVFRPPNPRYILIT